jgi:hypothetical protein
VIWPFGLSVALAMARPELWVVGAAFLAWEHRYIGHQALASLRFLRAAAPLRAAAAS